MDIERVGVVGAGLMGSGIAEVCARAGYDVLVREVNPELAEAGRGRIEKSLDRALERGKVTESEREEALSHLALTTHLAEFSDRQFVVEAATENEPVKLEIFSHLDGIVSEETILASNTSSIPITRLARATQRPDRVIGTHFFNPVPVMGLVEIVTGLLTSEETLAAARSFAESLGKQHVLSKDRAGFIVNMLLVPYLNEAVRMYQDGFATAEDIDKAVRLGLNHPMGPLELLDFVGIDTTKFIADILFEEFRLPQYAPPPILTRMVEAGLLGRKTGRGFYHYQ